jgi:hypothetical protein
LLWLLSYVLCTRHIQIMFNIFCIIYFGVPYGHCVNIKFLLFLGIITSKLIYISISRSGLGLQSITLNRNIIPQ